MVASNDGYPEQRGMVWVCRVELLQDSLYHHHCPSNTSSFNLSTAADLGPRPDPVQPHAHAARQFERDAPGSDAGSLACPYSVCPTDSRPFSLQAAPRVVLFDMGATTYADPEMNGLRWLVESFERLDLRIDELFAWEAKELKAAKFFDGMPPWLM